MTWRLGRAPDLARELAGATMLVTGAAGGIGQAVCAELTRAGCSVVAADLDVGRLDGRGWQTLVLDVTDDDAVRREVEALGPLDGLVLSHGLTALGPALDQPMQQSTVFSTSTCAERSSWPGTPSRG